MRLYGRCGDWGPMLGTGVGP